MTKDKIVLVPFPFDDLSAEKVRPAVCLTDPIGQHRHVILAFITSNTNQEFLDPATPDKSFLREIVRFDDKGASTLQILS